MASSSSSSEPEPASRHHGADDQRRVRLDELAEARRQLEEELALLRQELGVDAEPRDRQPAQDIPVQGEPPEGNGNRREHRPVADEPHDRAPTPPTRGPELDNNRRANGGANVDANADADAPPLFWRASQNLAVADMLLRGCLELATFEERWVRQQLKALLEAAAAQQAESSTSRQCSERGRAGAPSTHGPNPPPSQHQGCEEGVGAAAAEPNRDAWNTIEA
jgi:hypothetical protein